MDTIPRNDFILRHRYDAFCKAVLRNEAKSYWSEMAHRREREKSLDALTQEEMDKLSVVDDYPSDSYVFSSYGYDLLIDNELVAEAFAALPQTEQSIMIVHCTLDRQPHGNVPQRRTASQDKDPETVAYEIDGVHARGR